MFKNCTSLIRTPKILLSKNCKGTNFGCESMFYNCTSLRYGPSILLPEDMGTSIAMYESMFYNCKSLIQAPIINIQIFSARSINSLFNGCNLLNKIEVNFTEWTDTSGNWVKGVSPTGTFICPKDLPEIRGINNIPENWEIIRK